MQRFTTTTVTTTTATRRLSCSHRKQNCTRGKYKQHLIAVKSRVSQHTHTHILFVYAGLCVSARRQPQNALHHRKQCRDPAVIMGFHSANTSEKTKEKCAAVSKRDLQLPWEHYKLTVKPLICNLHTIHNNLSALSSGIPK